MPIVGVGTSFERYDTGGLTFVPIAEVSSISGPGMSRDMLDSTSLDSTGGYREFTPGLRNPGTIKLSLFFTNAGYQQMKSDFEDSSPQQYQIVLADTSATTLGFYGYVTDCPLTIPEGIVTFDVTIQISGQVTVTP